MQRIVFAFCLMLPFVRGFAAEPQSETVAAPVVSVPEVEDSRWTKTLEKAATGVVTIQIDMHDQMALKLQDDLSNAIVKNASRGVLIDISTLEMVDSFIGRMVADISTIGKILGAETILVGMQPAVAITLVELGLSLPGVATALNVERGMVLLRRKIDADGTDGSQH